MKKRSKCVTMIRQFTGGDIMVFWAKLFIKDYKNVSDFKVRNAYGKLSSVLGIILNLILFGGKFLAGYLTGSIAITADAFNNLSDASSSIISLIGFKLSEKPADKDHPYGHGRYEYIAGLAVAVLVMVIGIELLKSGIDKIIHPTDTEITIVAMIILVVSILFKLYMMYFNTKAGKMIGSKTLIATAQDSRNDVISTGAVLIASLVMYFFKFNIDGFMGVAVALFILISGFGLIRDTLDPILGQSPDKELVEALQNKVIAYEHVEGIHDLIIHDYGPGNIFASVHAEVDSKYDPVLAHDEIDNIEKDVQKTMGILLTIHYDPIAVGDPFTDEAKAYIKEVVSGINKSISIHDFRTVPGVTHTNILFDMVLPYSIAKSSKDIESRVEFEVKRSHPDWCLVITIDHDMTSTLE